MACTVSYTIVNSSGDAIPNAIWFAKRAVDFDAGADDVRFHNVVTITAGNDGTGTIDLEPGIYAGTAGIATALQGVKDRQFFFQVPDAASADLEDLLTALAPEVALPTLAAINALLSQITIETKTANYSLAAADAGKLIEVNSGSAVTVTIPTDASASWLAGAIVSISKVGLGDVNITAASGVTLNGVSAGSTEVLDQYGACHVYRRAANEWVIVGGIGDVT